MNPTNDMQQTYLALVAGAGFICAVVFAAALLFMVLDRRDAQARGPGALRAWRRDGWAIVATMWSVFAGLVVFGLGVR